MNKKIILLIAHDGYQAIEYGVTKDVLEKDGVLVIPASDTSGKATAHDGSSEMVTMTVDQIDPQAIDGLFIIGGPGAMDHLNTPKVHALLQEMMTLNKPFGAICIASRILAKAGVLGGKKATGWNGDEKLNDIFKNHAVSYTGKPVTTDGRIVTAEGPSAAEHFGKSIVQVIATQ